MPNYIVNKKDDGKYHEVHTTHCNQGPDSNNQHWLGAHATCRGALQAAERAGFKPADGCYYCCNDCHSG